MRVAVLVRHEGSHAQDECYQGCPWCTTAVFTMQEAKKLFTILKTTK